jgi:hypothetical protein
LRSSIIIPKTGDTDLSQQRGGQSDAAVISAAANVIVGTNAVQAGKLNILFRIYC